jgi:hypothetical protein
MNHEDAISKVTKLFKQVHTNDLPIVIDNLVGMVTKFNGNDEVSDNNQEVEENNQVSEENNQVKMPPKAKTKGRHPQQSQESKFGSSVARMIFFDENSDVDKNLRLARWWKNSCYIDCIVEFMQRSMVSNIYINSDGNTPISKLLKKWQKSIHTGIYVRGTWCVRNYCWKIGFKQVPSDCQEVYHHFIDSGYFDTFTKFKYDDGKTKNGFEIIHPNDEQLSQVFAKYSIKPIYKSPRYLIINDVIKSLEIYDQFDYPDTITINNSPFDYNYKIYARIMAVDSDGLHF